MRPGTIVVGTDGSPSGMTAVRWAAETAEYSGRPLEVVVAYHWEVPGRWYGSTREVSVAADERAGAIAALAVAEARVVAPHIEVSTSLLPGDPAAALLGLAGEAGMVVVGSRGRGGFSGLLLGSVSTHVATHARSPVTVVRGRTENRFDPVVVGINVMHPTEGALDLAFEHASARRCPLHVVAAHPVALPSSPIGTPPVMYEPQLVRAELHAELVRHTTTWRGKYSDVPVEHTLVEGSPSTVLVDQSHHAQLVVIGARRHGELAGLLLGSAGLYLLHHATCPVLVASG
jgi:nucleotide-binding universal stress UspA family protein